MITFYWCCLNLDVKLFNASLHQWLYNAIKDMLCMAKQDSGICHWEVIFSYCIKALSSF